jgi:hypothetical protein
VAAPERQVEGTARMMANVNWLKSGFVVVAMALVLPAGCKKPDKGRAGKRAVEASVAEFDPSQSSFDLDKYGTARVDEFEVQEAFNRTFDGLDQCVAETKKKHNIPMDQPLDGDVDFQVQLDPENPKPMGVNAKLSAGKWDKDRDLKNCLREAVADAGYPTYDGPPQVAQFSTDLDPGSEYVEEDDGWW